MARSKIKEIFIEITSHCNFNCSFCPNSIMKRPRGFMSAELFGKVVTEIAENNLAEQIAFHLMGEPLLHPEFIPFLKSAANKKQKIHLISNISLIDEKMIEPILRYVDVLEISLQSYDQASFEQRKAKKITYDKYLDLIKYLLDKKYFYGSKTKIKISLIENSLNVFKNFKKDIQLIDSSEKMQNFFEGQWTEYFQALAAKYRLTYKPLHKYKYHNFAQQFLPDVVFATRWTTTWGNNMTAGQKVIPAVLAKCDGLSGQLGILWNGDVVPCCGDYDGRVVLGNLQTDTLTDVLNSELARKMRSGFRIGQLIHPYCRGCKGGTNILSWLASQLYSYIKFWRI